MGAGDSGNVVGFGGYHKKPDPYAIASSGGIFYGHHNDTAHATILVSAMADAGGCGMVLVDCAWVGVGIVPDCAFDGDREYGSGAYFAL